MEVTQLAPDDELPAGWHRPRVIDIAAKRANATVGGPFGSDLVAKDYVYSGVPVIRGQNMGQRYVAGEFAFVSPAKAKALQANLARPSDLVFTQRGTLGQVALVPAGPYEEYLISQSQMKLTLDCGTAEPGYVHQYFASALGQKQILDSAIQTGVPHTNLGILRNYAVPMPRQVGEQEAIAVALTDADALIDSLEQLLTKKRQIKQGAMQELLTGKRRLPGFSQAWSSRELRDLVQTPVTDGPHTTPEFVESGVPFLSVNNLVGNRIDLTDLRFISKDDDQLFAKKCKPQREDVLLGKAASVGKVAIVENDLDFNIWSPIALIRPGEAIVPKFLYYQLQSHSVLAQITVLTNSSSQGNLGMGDIEKLQIWHPCVDEQGAVASVLSDMDADITALESRLTKARALKQAMAQALLTGRIRLVEGAAA